MTTTEKKRATSSASPSGSPRVSKAAAARAEQARMMALASSGTRVIHLGYSTGRTECGRDVGDVLSVPVHLARHTTCKRCLASLHPRQVARRAGR